MKSMKVMIYGEGPTDYGWKNKSGKWEKGFPRYILPYTP